MSKIFTIKYIDPKEFEYSYGNEAYYLIQVWNDNELLDGKRAFTWDLAFSLLKAYKKMYA